MLNFDANFDATLAQARKAHEAGNLDLAENLYRSALAIRPNHARSLHFLGLIAYQRGNLPGAVATLQQAAAADPANAKIFGNLGLFLSEARQLVPAQEALRRSLALDPRSALVLNTLGNVLKNLGRYDEALDALRQAIALNPNFPEAHNNLGVVHFECRQFPEAIAAYRHALSLRPRYVGALNNLGAALRESENLDEAYAAYRAAVEMAPQEPSAHINLGSLLKDTARIDESVAAYRRAIALDPASAYGSIAGGNLLVALHYHPDSTPQSLAAEHAAWRERFADPLKPLIAPHANTREPNRRLKIGYVSRDLGEHPVGRFLLPLFARRDRENFHVTCYAQVGHPDAVTARLREQSDAWHNILGHTDSQLAAQIREDNIDILVDLGMHTGNRMPLFARKPAPVQITYLAYASTTGLDAIDYRLSDPYLDPPGTEESVYAEKTLRLTGAYWCYQPPEGLAEVAPLPALAAGRVTFGSLNNFCKVSAPALAAFAGILAAVPGSHLLLHAPAGQTRTRLLAAFAARGIAADRLRFVGRIPTADYFALYHHIDIALDPFPFSGGTTTCDALYMGAPVVTLAGQTAVGRAGVSILSHAGLPDLITATPEQYVRRAVALAADIPHLAERRASLREHLRASPLMDAADHARAVEAAYRQAWQAWCAGA